MKWYEFAANKGYAPAQNSLGVMFQNGRGVVQSDDEAMKWYWRAADQGNAAAQSNLGAMYSKAPGER